MSRLAYWGAGACLADDMGLGKTLQAITLMQSRAAQGPQLVIMPTSLLHNWQAELARFAPAMSVKVLNQAGANRRQMVGEAADGDVVLATYGLLVTEGELLSEPTWTTIVLDEAHTIKNRDTQTSKAAMMLKADFRLLLTGTPLQNHLNEIWNLFQFSNPGLLGSYQQFTDRFFLPIERNRLVRQFQTGDQPLFLISLKAGGLGLNLTAADYVIHLDPWWNPAVEDQTSDRAHRIGQERPVTVYRLFAAGTIEEKIIRLHQNKRSMADALLQDADMFAQISADDVIKLLCESVDAIGEGE